MKRKLGLLLLVPAVGLVLVSQQSSGVGFSPYVDEMGNISRPQDYRDNWTHLGTYFVIGESQDGHSMHSVYTEKSNLEAYNESGEWPDGAALVKEVMHTAGDQLTTGASNWATEPNVWFVIVKDAKQRFPGNPLWGAGWGWALFKSDAPNVQVATDYKRDCLQCHLPAKETDLVYIQGYPSIDDRPKGPTKAASQATMTGSQDVDLSAGSARRGAEVFAKTCSFCHAIDSDERKTGPSLAVIAWEGRLPTGKPATAESILQQINNGGNGMPSFADSLRAEQKADVIAFVQSPR